MKNAQWTDPQFVDANGVGGLNAAFGQVSGSIASLGAADFAAPGLLSPESMTLGFGGTMVATVGLPVPWGLITSGGIVVRAHGTLTGADTTSYTVNFAPLVPATGSVTAYLTATVSQIQQNPFPLTGPPQGHPSFNPNFAPTTAYATSTYTVTLSGTTTPPNNTTVFELARTTLTPSQTSITVSQPIGWTRAAAYSAQPTSYLAAGGVLTLAQAQVLLTPAVTSLTSTLPVVATAGGLEYKFANALATGNYTVAASGADRITGANPAAVTSLVIPPSGTVRLYGNAANGQWEVVATNPVMMSTLPNSFSAVQTIAPAGATAALIVSGGTANGTAIQIIGNGTTTPGKYLRVLNGVFAIINNAYTAIPLSLDDTGNLTVTSSVNTGTLNISANATVNGTILAGGAITSNTNVTAANVLNGGSINSTTGNITSAARLRAVLGAFGSGDTNAATLLADFVLSTTTGYIYERLPNGFLVQGYQGINSTGVDSIFFPNAFPNTCIQVLAHEAAPAGWAGTSPSVMGTQNIINTSFALYVVKWNGIAFSNQGGISYRYIAIGY